MVFLPSPLKPQNYDVWTQTVLVVACLHLGGISETSRRQYWSTTPKRTHCCNLALLQITLCQTHNHVFVSDSAALLAWKLRILWDRNASPGPALITDGSCAGSLQPNAVASAVTDDSSHVPHAMHSQAASGDRRGPLSQLLAELSRLRLVGEDHVSTLHREALAAAGERAYLMVCTSARIPENFECTSDGMTNTATFNPLLS